MHKEHMDIKPYPGAPLGPMAVTRKVGKGRVIYLAGDLASIALPGEVADAEVLDVLANAALWAAGGKPPVRTNLSPLVQLVIHLSETKIALFIINQTMNQIEKQEIIRSVVPLTDIWVEIKLNKRVRHLATVTGQKVRCEFKRPWIRFCLPKVNEYEVLMAEISDK
jgi:hypothetical protein